MACNYTSAVGKIAAHNLKVIEQKNGILRFDKVLVFLNQGCNFSCAGCYVKAVKDNNSNLPFEKIREALLYAKKHGARFFVIPGYGEPLMDNNLWPSLELANELKMESVLYTNSSLIDLPTAKRFKKLSVRIIAKRNTFNHKTQDQLSGVKGASEMMLKGMKNLMQAGYKSPYLALESYIIKPILDDIKDVLRFCRKENLLPYFESYEKSLSKIPPGIGGELLTSEELTNFFDELAYIDNHEFGIKIKIPKGCRIYSFSPEIPIESSIIEVDSNWCCDRIFSTFCVAHNGNVSFCVDHRKTIGNIYQDSLDNIFDSKTNQQFRCIFRKPCSYESAKYLSK